MIQVEFVTVPGTGTLSGLSRIFVHLRYASRRNRSSIPAEPAMFPRKGGASLAILVPLLVLSLASAQHMPPQSSGWLDPLLAQLLPGKQPAPVGPLRPPPVGSWEPASETFFHAEGLGSPAKFNAGQSGPIFWGTLEYSSGGAHARAVAVADLNGDGHPDLVAANYCGNNDCINGSVGVLLGNGDGTFQAPLIFSSGGDNYDSVAIGDVNGDGKPDIIVANNCASSNNCTNGSVSVLLGNGDGTFQPAVSYSLSGLAYSVAIGDVNGDGKPDLVVANNGSVSVLLGNGDGTFQPAVSYGSGGQSALSVAIGDVNGDGKPDLVVGYSEAIAVLLGNGDGTFQAPVSYWLGAENTVAIGDVNGDGKPDLVVAVWCQSLCNSFVVVLLGNDDGTFQGPIFSPTFPLPLCCAPQSPALADFDGDGKLDVALGANLLMLGNGDGTFQTPMLLGASGFGVVAGDLNGDGKPELAVAGGNEVAILLNIAANFHWATTTAVASSANPTTGPVTFTATVTPAFNAGALTDNVTFYDGTTALGTVAISNGQSMFSTSSLSLGTHSITASYSGDSNYVASTSPVLLETINPSIPSVTTTAVVSSLNPSTFSQSVTFTATITPTAGGPPTGTVTFTNGSNVLGMVSLSSVGIGNAASLTTSALAIGTHSITAVYSGDSNFAGSLSNTLSQVVAKATTTTSLASSMNPSVSGKSVTLTAAVSSLSGTPTGKIQFLNGTTVLVTKKLTSGSAKYTTSKLPLGADSIKAVYEGDSNNNGSTSAPENQFVLASTTTTLSSSPNPSTYGVAVTFTSVVGSSAGTPPDGETVSFIKGKTVLGTGTLSGGSANFTTSALPVGTYSITAVYGGDSDFKASKSKAVKQVVKK